MAPVKYFIIDFDSTFVTTESLEELAEIALQNRKDKNQILKKIRELTTLGMEGKIPFEKSLSERIKLLKANKKHINSAVKSLIKKITPSIKRNRLFFKNNREHIFIISGGFKEIILPITRIFHIADSHVLGNSFIFDKKGNILHHDKSNPMAYRNGKVKAIKSLGLRGEIIIIGDGYTDYEVKKMGAAKHFSAFTENIKRETITKKADSIVRSFDEFLYINRLPMSISYPKSKIRVLLLEHIDNLSVKMFEKEGYEVDYVEKPLSDIEFFEKISKSWIMGIRSRTQVNKELLKYAKNLMVVGAYCIGTNQIDLAICCDKGIAVFNAPYSNTRSVVELVIGEIIMLQRGIMEKNRKLHQGIWDKSARNSFEIRGKKLGIIGYGNIGSQLSVLAESLGMEVYFYDIADKLALGNAKKCTSMKYVLKNCDISIHVDGNKNNNNLISYNEFASMKPGVIFLNASRGFVVDIRALASAIKSGKIKGAAVDVFPEEPKDKSFPFTNELINLPNVILTPHVAGSTEEAQKNIAEYVTTKIIDYINTGQTMMSVNIPNINQPKLSNTHRLLHLHENVPGILAQINKVLADYKINIEGQYLKTNENIGYVITDVNKKYDKKN